MCCAQAAFFGPTTTLETHVGFKWLGVCVIIVSQLVALMYFPMWGGMIFPHKKDATEEEYYTKEYTAQEIAEGQHRNSYKFVRTPAFPPFRPMCGSLRRAMHCCGVEKCLQRPWFELLAFALQRNRECTTDAPPP